MRIDEHLAKTIALAAIAEPYRQVDVLTTRDFVTWLRDRDISFQWETLHHLWRLGVLHPVAVLEPALSPELEKDRFLPLDRHYEVRSFVDLGQQVTEHSQWSPPLFKLPSRLADCLLWHPFQLWLFRWLARILEIPISLDSALSGPDSYSNLVRKVVSRIPKQMMEFGNADRHTSFLRVLALLLLAEPLVHVSITGSVRLQPYMHESFEGYYAWRHSQDGSAMLSTVGFNLEDAKAWQHELAVAAQINDPVERFRTLLRHASRSKLERLKGSALQAQSFYDAAEVLRRYLERYHGLRLLEEDDAIYGRQGPAVKERLYGSPRTAEFDRAVFRRIVRDFDLDPQARTTWFVEGDTEEGFIKRMAQHFHMDITRGGVQIMNLNGLGGLASDRLQEVLERLRGEEVFSFVSIDSDKGGEHLRLLRNYAKNGLLPAGFKVWKDDFEEANFSLSELAQVAEKVASDAGVPITISAKEIEQEKNSSVLPAGKAVVRLWNRQRFPGSKGAIWGEALADWAASNACPPEYADADGNRPITALLFRLLRGQHSNYWFTVKEYGVGDHGELVHRGSDS